MPPAINQFKEGVLAKNEAVSLFKLLNTYRRETKAEKKERLHAAAEDKVAGGAGPVGAKDSCLQFGLNHVTYLVEKKRAKLVCIASDVDPIEVRSRTGRERMGGGGGGACGACVVLSGEVATPVRVCARLLSVRTFV